MGGGERAPWGWGLALGDPISLIQLELFQGPYQSSQTWMEIHGPSSRPRREFSPLAPAGRGFRVQRGKGGMVWERLLPRTSEGPQRLTESWVGVSSLLEGATKDRLEVQAPRGTFKAKEVSKPSSSCEFWIQSPGPPTMSTGQVADMETLPCLQNIRTELGAHDCCYQGALVKLRHVASQTIPLGQSDQYSCLENPMDRGAGQATVHGVAKSWTQLSNLACMHV